LKNNQKICPNCSEKIANEAIFCSVCGQKHFDGKISIKDLFRDFFDNFLNLDLSIFRTIKTIIFPGRLTVKYFKGKHKTYANPFRIFIISIIPLLAVSTFGINDSISSNTSIGNAFQNLENITRLNDAISITKGKYNDPIVSSALDSLKVIFLPDSTIIADSLDVSFSTFTNNVTNTISTIDLQTLKIEDLKKKYDIETTFFQDIIFNQFLMIFQKEGSLDNLITYFVGKLNWLIIFMMPLIALAYKLVYIRRKRYYIEHLVFNLHIHSFAFILILFQIIVGKFISIDITLVTVFTLLIYFILALKSYYQQSWVKTIFKTGIIGLLYIIILGFSIAGYATVGLLLI